MSHDTPNIVADNHVAKVMNASPEKQDTPIESNRILPL